MSQNSTSLLQRYRNLSDRNRGLVAIIAALVIVGVVVLLSRPNKAEAVDIVNGAEPMSRSMAHIQPTLDELARMEPSRRAAFLRTAYPRLEADVVFYLRQMGRIPANASDLHVEFFFGSLDHAKAESGDGGIKEGYLRDQLLAKVSYAGAEPKTYAVKCLNGMVQLPNDAFDRQLQNLGSYAVEEVFTIGPREGIAHHTAYMTAIELAERNHIPIYRGKVLKPEFLITPDRARELATETGRVQITPLVFEGDRFNTRTGEYIPANRH